MQIKARAKINLTLKVFPRRKDGYHDLDSIVAPIDLADIIEIEKSDEITSDTGFKDDLCVRAAELLGVGAKMHVEKHIPVGGGLGGGSADGAAVLRALNELYELKKSPEDLAELGSRLGSDVPALVLAQHYARAVRMSGRGEVVQLMDEKMLSSVAEKTLFLLCPGVHSSTAEVYAQFDRIGGEGLNSLEKAAISLYPEIARALEELREAGCEGSKDERVGLDGFWFRRRIEEKAEFWYNTRY